MKETLSAGLVSLVLAFAMPGLAYAHVTVKPRQVVAGEYTTFTVGVPNEKDVKVTGVRLVIPNGIASVQPVIQEGWDISTKTSGGEVTEISWEGNSVPAGRTAALQFIGQAKNADDTLAWKAYQTYGDGTVIAWDQPPDTEGGHESEDKNKGPYSETAVVAEKAAEQASRDSGNATENIVVTVLSVLALILAAFAVLRKR